MLNTFMVAPNKINIVDNINYSDYSSANANKIRQAVLQTKTKILQESNLDVIKGLVEELEELIKQKEYSEKVNSVLRNII